MEQRGLGGANAQLSDESQKLYERLRAALHATGRDKGLENLKAAKQETGEKKTRSWAVGGERVEDEFSAVSMRDFGRGNERPLLPVEELLSQGNLGVPQPPAATGAFPMASPPTGTTPLASAGAVVERLARLESTVAELQRTKVEVQSRLEFLERGGRGRPPGSPLVGRADESSNSSSEEDLVEVQKHDTDHPVESKEGYVFAETWHGRRVQAETAECCGKLINIMHYLLVN
eukprot:s331_g20.t1